MAYVRQTHTVTHTNVTHVTTMDARMHSYYTAAHAASGKLSLEMPLAIAGGTIAEVGRMGARADCEDTRAETCESMLWTTCLAALTRAR